MALGDKQNASVSSFAQPFLEPGEQERAVAGQVMKGPSIWLLALISPMLVFLQTPYGVVVTDRRVILVRLKTGMTGYPPKAIEGTYPLSEVSASYARGPLTGRLLLRLPGRDPLSLQAGKIYQDGAERVAAAVAAAAAKGNQPDQP